MKATLIRYERIYSLGDYQNHKIGIEFQIQDNEKAQDVFDQARRWCDMQHDRVVQGLDGNQSWRNVV